MKSFLSISALVVGSSSAFMASAPAPSPISMLNYGPSTLDRPIAVEDSSDFEKKMRKVVLKKHKLKKPSQPDNIQIVQTMEEFNKVVGEEPEKLVVVRFHAPWCRACKLMTPSYFRIAKGIDESNVKFVDCPMTSVSSEVHKELGIRAIPFAHVYHPEAGLVEERRVSRQQLSSFEKVVQSYIGGSCDVANDDCESPYKP